MRSTISLSIKACLVLLCSLTTISPAFAGACPNAPWIEVSQAEPGHVSLAYNTNCWGEDSMKIWRRDDATGSSTVVYDLPFATNGWRYADDLDPNGPEPGRSYCYWVETVRDGASKYSTEACSAIPVPAIALDLLSSAAGRCGSPSTPGATGRREHIYMSSGLATALGIDTTAVTDDGPSPQLRLIVESPTLSGGLRSTASYTIAGLCTGESAYDWDLWIWETHRLGLSASSLSQADIRVEPVAPSRTTIRAAGQSTQVQNHFTEPNSGSRYLREEVTVSTDKRVAVLVPHGGGIERNTSAQVDPFVAALGSVQANVWDNQGQWGNLETYDRWHITSGDIHPDGFPGLDRLTSEPPFDASQGRAFQYAVAFHGFDDSTGFGVILGGRAGRDVLCHVAQSIRDEASSVVDRDGFPADRSDAIGFHIADAGASGQNLLIPNAAGYFPAPSNADDLEGRNQNNIVNWLSAGDTDGDQVDDTWGGIQLEQSKCLRREMDCASLADGDSDGVNDFCTGSEDACLHEVVARGVAQAVAELVDASAPLDPTGSCCTHFGACP